VKRKLYFYHLYENLVKPFCSKVSTVFYNTQTLPMCIDNLYKPYTICSHMADDKLGHSQSFLILNFDFLGASPVGTPEDFPDDNDDKLATRILTHTHTYYCRCVWDSEQEQERERERERERESRIKLALLLRSVKFLPWFKCVSLSFRFNFRADIQKVT